MPASVKAVPAPTPRHTVAGDTFVWRSDDPDVGEVRVPLKFKTKILRAARDVAEGDDLSFMFTVLDGVLGEGAVDEMDAGEMRAMFTAWQTAWTARTEATFPQS